MYPGEERQTMKEHWHEIENYGGSTAWRLQRGDSDVVVLRLDKGYSFVFHYRGCGHHMPGEPGEILLWDTLTNAKSAAEGAFEW